MSAAALSIVWPDNVGLQGSAGQATARLTFRCRVTRSGCTVSVRMHVWPVRGQRWVFADMETDMGVPQGTAAAPPFFSITPHAIQGVGRPGHSISLHADDLAIQADCPANKNLWCRWLELFQWSTDNIKTSKQPGGFEPLLRRHSS